MLNYQLFTKILTAVTAVNVNISPPGLCGREGANKPSFAPAGSLGEDPADAANNAGPRFKRPC